MKHLESAFTGRNSLWRYAIMVATVFLAANSIGAIPLFIGFGLKAAADPGAITNLASNPNDLSMLGFDQNITLIMLLFPSVAGFIAFMLLVRPLNNRTLIQTINGTSSIRWNRIIISGFVWTLFSALYLFLYKGIDPANFRINNLSVTLVYLAVISMLLIPFQASLEEIIFRGYLFQGFALIFRKRWMPLLLTSLLFGVLHAWNPEIEEFGFWTMMPQYVLFGLLFGITTLLDDGIEIAIGAHAANNIFLSIMVTHSASVFHTPAVFEQLDIQPWTEFIALAITAFIFLFAMKKIFRWDNFSILLKRSEPEVKNDQVL